MTNRAIEAMYDTQWQLRDRQNNTTSKSKVTDHASIGEVHYVQVTITSIHNETGEETKTIENFKMEKTLKFLEDNQKEPVKLFIPEDELFRLKLDHSQHFKFSKFVRGILYRDDLRSQIYTFSGYPYNGGQHTLTLTDRPEKIIQYLELLKRDFPNFCAEIEMIVHDIERSNKRYLSFHNKFQEE